MLVVSFVSGFPGTFVCLVVSVASWFFRVDPLFPRANFKQHNQAYFTNILRNELAHERRTWQRVFDCPIRREDLAHTAKLYVIVVIPWHAVLCGERSTDD